MANEILTSTEEYMTTLATIKSEVQNSQLKAAAAVNSELITLYWNIGSIINQHKKWGNKFIDTLSMDIRSEFPKIVGFSVRNLKSMSKFAETYTDFEIVQTLSAQLSWSHNVALLKVKDDAERKWYLEQSRSLGWSFRELQHQLEIDVYHRQVLTEKSTNFDSTLPMPQSGLAQDMMKDPYVFDFIAVRKGALERVIENELVQNVTKFLLELGNGFSFVGQQYPLHVGDKDFYIDLLFFHIELNCYIVIELKAVDFKPEFAGKLNFYVNAVDGELRKEGQNPTIGILLCKNKDRLMAEYALKNINSPIGVAEYSITEVLPDELVDKIPSVEDIEARFLKDFQGEENEENER